MKEERKRQWHPAFYGALRLELAANKEELEFTEEFILNTLPLRIDTLVIKKKSDCNIKNEIGKIFRVHNLIEYKSPNDTFNYNTFLKGVACAYLYKAQEKHVDDILLSEITLSFIRHRKPIKLFQKLISEDFSVEEYFKGIYYVSRSDSIAIQIIVSNELEEKNHIWLSSLTNQLERKQAEYLVDITNELEDIDDKYYADSVWEIVASLNDGIIQELREDKGMCEALARIMKPEIDAAVEAAVETATVEASNDKGIQVFKNMIKSGISREDAQRLAEISDELVEKALVGC